LSSAGPGNRSLGHTLPTLEWCAVAALALAGLTMLHGRTLRSGFTRLPGDLGDTRFLLLVLEHGFRYLRGDALAQHFWSPAWEFFPSRNALAYSENLVGDLPLYVPLRLWGLDPTRAFGAWIVLCSLLNFWATVLLGRSLGLSRLGSGAAATLFAFGMPRSQQLNHVQLFPQFWTPLCFFALVASWRAWRANRWLAARLWVAGSLACIAGQVAAGVYLGDFLMLGLLALASLGAVRIATDGVARADVRHFVERTATAWLVGGALAATLLFPIGAAYGRAHRELGGRDWREVGLMLPRVVSYLAPNPGSTFYGWLNPLGAGLPLSWEHTMFAGFAPLIALAWLATAWWRRKLPVADWVVAATVGVWCLACLTTLYLGSYHGDPVSLWRLVRVLPGLDALRGVSRITMLELLPAGLAVGIAVTALMRSARRWQVVLGGLLAVLPLVENWSQCPANVSRDEILSRARAVPRASPRAAKSFSGAAARAIRHWSCTSTRCLPRWISGSQPSMDTPATNLRAGPSSIRKGPRPFDLRSGSLAREGPAPRSACLTEVVAACDDLDRERGGEDPIARFVENAIASDGGSGFSPSRERGQDLADLGF